jgi:ribosome-binding protein aMBF1 (putative translation factor)
MQKVLETTIIKHDKEMEVKTHKEMLDKYIGEVGTPERDAFEAQVRAGVEEYRIGDAIKQTRKKIGFTQQQLGERMGVKRAEVSKIESGRSITYSTIMRAFKALGAETATLDLGRLGRVALW